MVKLHDLLEYRARRRDAQYKALLETSGDYDDVLEDDATVQERFRRVRAEVAAERRAAASP